MSILAAATVDRQGGCGRGGSRSRGERGEFSARKG